MLKDNWKEGGGANGWPRKLLKLFFGDGSGLLLLGLVFAVLAVVFVYSVCTCYVKPNEFGVMQVDVSPLGLFGRQGIHTNVYNTGIHIQVPGLQKIHKFPKDLQVLTLKPDPHSAESAYRFITYANPAHIQTSDGFYIDLDVSIIYRITNPYQVITSVGAGKLYEDNGLIPKAEPMLKETMGKLKPEDFFNSTLRAEKQEEARLALNNLLREKGIAVEHVLVRYPKYHPDVQARIEGRNLQEQTRHANMAKAKEAAADAELKRVVEEGKALVSIKLTNGTVYAARRRAEMQSYERIKKSEADKLNKLAEAAKSKLINEAYQGPGADRLVGMEMADILKGLETILVPAGGEKGFNPLDMESLMRSFQIPLDAASPAVKTGGKAQ